MIKDWKIIHKILMGLFVVTLGLIGLRMVMNLIRGSKPLPTPRGIPTEVIPLEPSKEIVAPPMIKSYDVVIERNIFGGSEESNESAGAELAPR